VQRPEYSVRRNPGGSVPDFHRIFLASCYCMFLVSGNFFFFFCKHCHTLLSNILTLFTEHLTCDLFISCSLQHFAPVLRKWFHYILFGASNWWTGTVYIVRLPTWSQKYCTSHLKCIYTNNKLHGLSSRANYTDRATAVSRRSGCRLLRINGATWSAWRIPAAVFSGFSRREPLRFYQVAPQLYSRGWVDPVPDPLLVFLSPPPPLFFSPENLVVPGIEPGPPNL
jgi:hypothetical protein